MLEDFSPEKHTANDGLEIIREALLDVLEEKQNVKRARSQNK